VALAVWGKTGRVIVSALVTSAAPVGYRFPREVIAVRWSCVPACPAATSRSC
jgi:hypothetical protein